MQTRELSESVDLPDELALPLGTGAPWWYWLGGRPCLDLVNTRRERWWRSVETLVTRDDLGAWLVACGLMPELQPVKAGALEEARELREAIDAALTAVLAERPVPKADVKTIDSWLPHAGDRPQLTISDGVAVLGERAAADSPRRALGTVALDAARMLGQPEQRERIRICASETCSARFYDRSPAGKRRWCSMKTCGNVAKARRHRQRARGAGRKPPDGRDDRLEAPVTTADPRQCSQH